MGRWKRDHTGCWGSSIDGTLETRQYFMQNRRADVVAVIDSAGVPIEYVRYSPYGEPTVYAAGDMNRDGVCDSADETAWDDLWNSTSGDAVAELDVNRDWVASDSDDYLMVIDQSAYGQWASSGRGVLSRVGVRKGYAGYEWDPATGQDHVRHRVYLPEMGRWGRRDPIGYVDGVSLYGAFAHIPISQVDPTGLDAGGGGQENYPGGIDHILHCADQFDSDKAECLRKPEWCPGNECARRHQPPALRYYECVDKRYGGEEAMCSNLALNRYLACLGNPPFAMPAFALLAQVNTPALFGRSEFESIGTSSDRSRCKQACYLAWRAGNLVCGISVTALTAECLRQGGTPNACAVVGNRYLRACTAANEGIQTACRAACDLMKFVQNPLGGRGVQ